MHDDSDEDLDAESGAKRRRALAPTKTESGSSGASAGGASATAQHSLQDNAFEIFFLQIQNDNGEAHTRESALAQWKKLQQSTRDKYAKAYDDFQRSK